MELKQLKNLRIVVLLFLIASAVLSWNDFLPILFTILSILLIAGFIVITFKVKKEIDKEDDKL